MRGTWRRFRWTQRFLTKFCTLRPWKGSSSKNLVNRTWNVWNLSATSLYRWIPCGSISHNSKALPYCQRRNSHERHIWPTYTISKSLSSSLVNFLITGWWISVTDFGLQGQQSRETIVANAGVEILFFVNDWSGSFSRRKPAYFHHVI